MVGKNVLGTIQQTEFLWVFQNASELLYLRLYQTHCEGSGERCLCESDTGSNRYWQLGDATRLQISIPAYAATILSKNCPQITALKEVVSGLYQCQLQVLLFPHLHILW